MKIVTLSKEEFEDFSNKHPYNSFYQSPNYAEFARINNQYDYHYLGFVDKNNNLIGASLLLYKTLFLGYKYAYAPRGFLFAYDDINMVTDLTMSLIRLLKKQKFIFITIDPLVVNSERDSAGNVVQENNLASTILYNFKKNGYEHLGFNLYNESKLPRFNVIARLNKDSRVLYNNFDNNIKEKITYTNSIAVNVIEDFNLDINAFCDYAKDTGMKINKKYFQNLVNAFKFDNKVKIFYARLDTRKYVKNVNELYRIEEEKNKSLADIIQSGDTNKYNIPKAINDKISSDKALHTYKKDIVASTKLLKSFPEGVTCGGALTICDTHGVNILINCHNREYDRYNIDAILTYEIMKYFGKDNYQYINIGSITGNFDNNSKYYSLLTSKLGFNSSIIEYLGEFNIIINPLIYNIYKKKYKK